MFSNEFRKPIETGLEKISYYDKMLIIPALLHLLFIDSLTVSPKTLSCMRSIVDEFLVFFFTEDSYVH